MSANLAELVTCPSCNGKGESFCIACGTHCRVVNFNCFTCRGSGTVTAGHLAFMNEAETIRLDRVERRLTIREEGKRLGVDFAEWSRIEGGRLPETDAGRRALAVRRAELAIQ